MKRKPSTEGHRSLGPPRADSGPCADAVEQDLKKAGFPPLAWYDALLELSRAQHPLRPVELEKQMLLPQYSTSAPDRPAGR